MKKKMTKKEIEFTKKISESRKNRRLSEGEYDRIMSFIKSKEDEGIPTIDLDGVEINLTDSKIRDKKHSMTKETINLQKRLYDIIQDPNGVKKRLGKTKNNRLTDPQFKSLMKKAYEELGINDREGYPILDLDTVQEISQKECIDILLNNMENSDPRKYSQYKEMTNGKRVTYRDKLSLIAWIIGVSKNKPMRFLDKKDKVNEVRNKKIGLKKGGDIKIRPIRVIPDEEYIREVTGKKRTKFDSFDKMDKDKKIIWARYANSILGEGVDVKKVAVLFCQVDADIVKVAMEYACKMTGISFFQGRYKEPFWIVHRANKYNKELTSTEHEVFLDLAQKHIESRIKSPSKILNTDELYNKLTSILSNLGIDEKYKEWHQKRWGDSKPYGRGQITIKRIMQFINSEYYKLADFSE